MPLKDARIWLAILVSCSLLGGATSAQSPELQHNAAVAADATVSGDPSLLESTELRAAAEALSGTEAASKAASWAPRSAIGCSAAPAARQALFHGWGILFGIIAGLGVRRFR